WSASDDGICRGYYESLLDTAKRSDLTLDERLLAEQKIVSVSLTEPPTNTSSRYKQRETFKFLQRQGKLEVPGYVELVKTSAGNELPPQESETWFYKRAASAARHVYMRKNVGVGKLNKLYGGAINRGFRPHKHADASGSVNRRVVQALEKIGVLEISPKGGRRISENGQRDLDRIAAQTLEEDDE
ncbi:hypothetical protein HF325_004362, partial [Metschnikowia pulcherrima]